MSSAAQFGCPIAGCDLSAFFNRAIELGSLVQPLLPSAEGQPTPRTYPINRQLGALGISAVRSAHLLEHGLSPRQAGAMVGSAAAGVLQAIATPPLALSGLVQRPGDAVILAALETQLSPSLRAAVRAWDEFDIPVGDIADARLQHVLSNVPRGTQNISTFDIQTLLQLRAGRPPGAPISPGDVLPRRYRRLCQSGRIAGIDMTKVEMSNGSVLPCVVLATGWPPRIVALLPAFEDLPFCLTLVQTFVRDHGKAFDILAFDGYATYNSPVFRAYLAGIGLIGYSVRHSCENPAERAIRLFKDLLPRVDHRDPLCMAEILIDTLRRHLGETEVA